MSEPCGSISGVPWVIHSAIVLAMPGASLIQIAATDQRPLTSGVSPRIGIAVGGQREQPVDRVADADPLVAEDVGNELEGLLQLRVEVVLGERQLGRRERRGLDRRDVVGLHEDRPVGVRADLEVAAVLALVHVRVHVAHDRVRRSRPAVSANMRHRPDVIIWWTAGVSGIEAPAMRAMRGLQMPQAMTTDVRLDVALVRPDAGDAAVDDVEPGDLGLRRDGQGAHARAAPRASGCPRAASRRRRRRACRSRRG